MKYNNRKEKGITLIALVVTIILLLILAGVTISQIAGSNGLFQRARQAVEKYKNAAEEEQIQIGMLEQYVSDFSVVVGDEGENKSSVTIKTFTVSGDAKNKQITVKLTVEGEANKIQLSIDNGKTWVPNEEELEGTEGAEEETEYTYTFENLDLGKSYYVRVKVYDNEGKYVEAISDIVTLSNSITAEEKDVLKDKTYLAEDGSVKKGTMPSVGAISGELSAGQSREIPLGYTSGGKITAKDLASQTPGDATKGDILNGKKAWVNGDQVTGNMPNKSGQTVTTSTVTTNGDYTQLTIPQNGYYNTESKVQILNNSIKHENFQIKLRSDSWGTNAQGLSEIVIPNFGYKYLKVIQAPTIANLQHLSISGNEETDYLRAERYKTGDVIDISSYSIIKMSLRVPSGDFYATIELSNTN